MKPSVALIKTARLSFKDTRAIGSCMHLRDVLGYNTISSMREAHEPAFGYLQRMFASLDSEAKYPRPYDSWELAGLQDWTHNERVLAVLFAAAMAEDDERSQA
jgi:hypothetical protein